MAVEEVTKSISPSETKTSLKTRAINFGFFDEPAQFGTRSKVAKLDVAF